jgi:hypothetical protein
MRSYDPTEVVIVFNGAIIDGYGPDSIIKASRNNDTWTLQMGNSGSGARSRNPDKSGKVEFTLLTSSPANAVLSAFVVADELRGEGVGEFQVKDRSTSVAKCSAENAWIVKPPDWERAKEVGTITWTLESDLLNIDHDGVIDE